MKSGIEHKILICQCHSFEHQVIFWLDEEDGDLYCEPHLITNRGFFKRLWYGLKYAFGHKSKYGAWDTAIFKKEELVKLKNYLNRN